MKKAKVTLMAIAVIGIAGGALAFKAKNFGNTVPTYSICDGSSKCSLGEVDEVGYTTTFSVTGTITVNATTDNGKTCSSNTDCQPLTTLYVKS